MDENKRPPDFSVYDLMLQEIRDFEKKQEDLAVSIVFKIMKEDSGIFIPGFVDLEKLQSLDAYALTHAIQSSIKCFEAMSSKSFYVTPTHLKKEVGKVLDSISEIEAVTKKSYIFNKLVDDVPLIKSCEIALGSLKKKLKGSEESIHQFLSENKKRNLDFEYSILEQLKCNKNVFIVMRELWRVDIEGSDNTETANLYSVLVSVIINEISQSGLIRLDPVVDLDRNQILEIFRSKSWGSLSK